MGNRACPEANANNYKANPFKVDSCHKLCTYDWLHDLPSVATACDIVEVRFKNTRKGFYKNINNIRLHKGDIVAVEASPGHDLGIVSLTGELVQQQMKKYNIPADETELKKIYRKAKPADIEKWEKAIDLERSTMLKARTISSDLKLEMKIGDVEYQGDKTKAIFYYIAEERVDFRELIKVLAEEFKVRIEMKQIGARQEAGRMGGIGSCGRELCCTTWISNFVSVTTNAARHQEVSLNPQKLAGQCGKLKCCLNYELDCYLDAKSDFPDISINLETKSGTAYHQKTDIFRKIMWYSLEQQSSINLIPLSVERIKEIIEINKKGKPVESLDVVQKMANNSDNEYENVVGQESLNRFDKKNNNTRKKQKRKNN